MAEAFIPHYGVEAGVKVAITDGHSRAAPTYGTTVELTSRNIPLMTLVGQTR